MSLTPTEIQALARRRFARIQRRRKDARFQKVLGRLVAAGHLTTNFPVTPHQQPIDVDDALWAGDLEPRILELLPALIVKTPSLFEDVRELPADLETAVRSLRRHQVPSDFRGIPGRDVYRWLGLVGRKKLPSRMKAFRLQADDLRLLQRLGAELEVSETEVVRRGLRALAGRALLEADRGGDPQLGGRPSAAPRPSSGSGADGGD